jgi:hypothetical protein
VFTHTRKDLTNGISFFIIERIPTFGTAILSIVSGYLYFEISRLKPNLFLNKIKSLAIPYLIANLLILSMVLFFKYVIGYDSLNRLEYDYTLITEGIFAFNSVPINPPTYFVRDIFVIFSIIALITQKELKALFVILPLLLFGTVILRMDVASLFLIGCLYAYFKNFIDKKILIGALLIVTIFVCVYFIYLLKFPLSFLIFILLIDIQFKFFNTSRYSYLLHLYHSPIIVISYPFLLMFIDNWLLIIIIQIIVALLGEYLLFTISNKYKILVILSGGR